MKTPDESYLIELTQEFSWAEECSWDWVLSLDGIRLAHGETVFRFFARRAAEKAAGRHAKGLSPVKLPKPAKPGKFPDNRYNYHPKGK